MPPRTRSKAATKPEAERSTRVTGPSTIPTLPVMP